jgi:hypothetical protein
MYYALVVGEMGKDNPALVTTEHAYSMRILEKLGIVHLSYHGIVCFGTEQEAKIAAHQLGNHEDNLSNCGNPWYYFEEQLLQK